MSFLDCKISRTKLLLQKKKIINNLLNSLRYHLRENGLGVLRILFYV